MEWQQILGFYHVARLGSFTKAAEATFRTQSALSQQVKNLEDELECRLLERIGRRGLRLTTAGQRFFQFSETVLAGYDSLVEELETLKGMQKGRLKIAAPFTTLYHLFPFALKRYAEAFPNVEITVLDRSQQRVLDLVKNGDVDFGLALESVTAGDLIAFRWKKVRTVLMTPARHPLTRLKRVTLRQIAKYPLILPPRNLKYPYRSILEDKLQKQGLDFHIILESSNVELSAAYVENGLGLSFATIIMDLPALKQRSLAFLPMDHISKPDYIAVVMRKDKTLSGHKSAFINVLFGETF